jgi:hypothetical protein
MIAAAPPPGRRVAPLSVCHRGTLGTFRVLWITLRCGKFFPSLTTYELRFLSYTAADDGRPATAEFAVALLRYEPDAVDVAVVDEERGKTLYKPDLLPVV